MLARRKRPHHSGFWCRTFESVAASLLTIASTAVSNFDTQRARAPYRAERKARHLRTFFAGWARPFP